jgi:hypothetical protein
MHLEGPWLSTTGKLKTKRKWASAEQKRKAEQLAEQWANTQAEWAKYKPFSDKKVTATNLNSIPKLSPPPGREGGPRLPSRDTGGTATLAPAKVYTGTKVKGIATMHKSNAVPIFSNEEAVDISRMRR